jgi:murein DD-endopeptidase MepM/ murein hydrolase activator NlpD
VRLPIVPLLRCKRCLAYSLPDVPQVCDRGTVIQESETAPATQTAPHPEARRKLRRRVLFGLPAAALSAIAVVALVAAPALSLVGSAPSPTASETPLATPAATNTPTPEPTYGPIVHNPTGPTPGPTPIPPSLLRGYVWPLEKPMITLPFGPTSWGELLVKGQLFHDGLDIATECWDEVRAAHDGVVLAAGRDYVDFVGWQGDLTAFKKLSSPASWKATLPIVIVIDDGNGYRSIYAHEVEVTVKPGDHVKAGQVIGYEGATGHASGCHVHYSLFSPLEREMWEPLPRSVTEYKLPPLITKRIDPLLVLPYQADIEDLESLLPSGRAPSPSPWGTVRPPSPSPWATVRP